MTLLCPNEKLAAYAFLFNADHESLGSFYGPPCTSRVTKVLDKNKNISTLILRGDLVIHMLSLRVAEVARKPKEKFNSVSTLYKPDYEANKILICDLADSFKSTWNTLNTETIAFELANKNIWVVVLTSVTRSLAQDIHDSMEDFLPYLFTVEVDQGNPLQFNLFIDSLIECGFYSNEVLYWRCDGDEDYHLAKNLGFTGEPILLEFDKYYDFASRKPKFTNHSVRGKISQKRLEGSLELSHKEKLAYQLVEYLSENSDKEIFYSTDLVSGSAEFLCEEKKVKDYLLNIDHKDGGPKARFFVEVLGIKQEDWRYLASQISNAMKNSIIFNVKDKTHGISHTSVIMMRGRNGREALIETGWIIEPDKNMRLVTAYPFDKSIKHEINSPDPVVAPLELIDDERFAYIYNAAHKAGLEAAHKTIPEPLTLKDYAPVLEGLCGFAWIRLPDSRQKFSRWCKKNNIGHSSYKSGWEIWVSPKPSEGSLWDTQSIRPKEAYAGAFRDVLLHNGIQAEADSRLD